MWVRSRGAQPAVGPPAEIVQIVDNPSAQFAIDRTRSVGPMFLERAARQTEIFACLGGAKKALAGPSAH